MFLFREPYKERERGILVKKEKKLKEICMWIPKKTNPDTPPLFQLVFVLTFSNFFFINVRERKLFVFFVFNLLT